MLGDDSPSFDSTHPVEDDPPPEARGLHLVVVHPPELGQSIPLSPGLVLGRTSEVRGPALLHATVSRRHAEIQRGLGGLWTITDLGSRNGTLVDGRPCRTVAPLAPQTVVRLGDVIGVISELAPDPFHADDAVPGTGIAIWNVRQQLSLATRDKSPVLILGETGTGKERLARAVHERSGRTGPYVVVNCAELSPALVESQLFGHERGAFTGAMASKAGLFVAAEGGTIFLDEIGDLPLELQPKLLRVLEQGEVRPVGSLNLRAVDVRVVAATHHPLGLHVEETRFRRDLFARLAQWQLQLPPLRQRKEDLFHWIAVMTSTPLVFSADAAECLLLHAWPENLRGLKRVVQRFAWEERPVDRHTLLDALPELRDRPSSEADPEPPPPEVTPTRSAVPSREEFLRVYESTGRSVRATSKHFGRDRRQIYRWLERFGIPREPHD